MWRRGQPPDIGVDETRLATPEEESAYDAGLDRVAEEKRRALHDPGPSWKAWFLHDAAKWWLGITFLVVDSWLIVGWLEVFDLPALLASGAAAIYLEYVLWSYLWKRPKDEARVGVRRFRRSWWRPFEYGRWTPEAERLRLHGGPPPAAGEGEPSPHEFL